MSYHLPDSPGRIVAALPLVLPRHAAPRDGRVVVVCLSQRVPGASLYLAAEMEDGDDPAETADTLLDIAAGEGATAVAVVVYAPDAADTSSFAAQHAAAVVLRAAGHGLIVLDAIRVVGDRWASYLCSEPSCCPPDGSPIPTPEEHHP